ncbi:hypothetical protein [uncultured Chryseobacterium sp.]|uniref:hypothetical protein n=1 Tax=uncultured Chryseobacterium sp. TaxID=259322 RepID=UPI0026001954|nr:hypothetical protein [uncultured Chryseobacterium sp.]
MSKIRCNALKKIKRKPIILSISFLMIFSCEQQTDIKNIKDHLLYKDSQDNIYLKGKIDIMSENNHQSNKTVFLDDVLYKTNVLKLKQFVDTISFHQIEIRDEKDIFVEGMYEDKKYKYIFRNHPASFSSIWISDKNLKKLN